MPYLPTEYCYTMYHSREWDSLVERGWVTMEDVPGVPGLVKMIWQGKRY